MDRAGTNAVTPARMCTHVHLPTELHEPRQPLSARSLWLAAYLSHSDWTMNAVRTPLAAAAARAYTVLIMPSTQNAVAPTGLL